MNALTHKYGIAIIALITLLAITGCQPVSMEQPTAIQTVAPPDIVVAEGEAYCPFMDFEDEPGSGKISDPELGDTYRAVVQSMRFSCAEPYMKARCVYIVDFIPDWSGFGECVTDEGGVWKGMGEWVLKPQFLSSETHEPDQFIAVGSYKGEGKYKGLQLYIELDQGTFINKFRVTKSMLKERPTATPTVAPTETVVTEGEVNCPITSYKEGDPLALVYDPELGSVGRALVVRWNLSCKEPYLNGKYISIQDAYLGATTLAWTSFSEGITDERGVWKGSCLGWDKEKPTQCTYNGEGKYKGLQISFEFDTNTNNVKFRLMRQTEE